MPHDPVLTKTFAAVAVNLLLFVLVASLIGGDAISGYEEHGRYFLRARGFTREVDWLVFTYSKWHATSVILSGPVLLLVFAARNAVRDKQK